MCLQIQFKENQFKSNYLQFLWGRKRTWLANAVSETIRNILKQLVSIAANTMFQSKKTMFLEYKLHF